MTLICEHCIRGLKRQSAIWQSGDRYYELVRWPGAEIVRVVITDQCFTDGTDIWTGIPSTPAQTFPIRKGTHWSTLKAHVPIWLMRMGFL